METRVTTLTNNFAVRPKSAFAKMVGQLFAQNAQSIGNQGTLRSVIGTCFASMSQTQHTWKRETFRDLLLHLEAQGCYALLREKECIEALANIASFGNKFVRGLATWEKDTLAVESQMSSLIRHCFALYEVPAFLENVFYEENKIHMFWYVQLGRGESVLDLKGFPVRFTRKMAHEFKKVPAYYDMGKAIRYAQAKGYGASNDMAETIAWSTLAEHFENEEFWSKVVKFLAGHETLPYGEVQEVLFYIHNKYEENKSYSVKGRNWESLVKQSNEWHVEYRKRIAALNRADWNPSGIGGYGELVETESETVMYTIIELTNSEALYEEGYEMSHCVAEYEYECTQGTSAIFSLRKKEAEETTILATIEVALEYKAIVQAKAKYNEAISSEAESILFEWAKKEKLELDYEEYYFPPAQAAAPGQLAEPERHFVVAQRGVESNINWRLILYIAVTLAKLLALLAK